ncbi:hypothetical protein [Sporisorium scitamineum]|uniref:Uncharacterized protein n=1 Tax=Sporisorium scitamineum TaxID=49012 RepID=A0A0F7S1L5_9BASI|nr:hypothetical protein [Sporisorium scitamineum]
MDSPSQQIAHSGANRHKKRKRGRQSNASISAHADGDVGKPPSTPRTRVASQPQTDTFSPFSHRSNQDSPRLAQPSSPSVILFSGPADRSFERVHDDTFPRDLQILKNMARSKFRFATAAPVEMSYVNPDGIVCDLNDEHDLRALAVHANFAQKLKVLVTSSSQEAVTQQPGPTTNFAAAPAPIQPLQPAIPDESTPPVAPELPHVNGHSAAKRKRTDDSPPPSASLSAPKTPASPAAPVAKKHRGRPKTSIASAPNAPAVSDAAVAESQSLQASASVASETPVPVQIAPTPTPASQPAENVAASQVQVPEATPRRGRQRKSAAPTPLSTTQDALVDQARPPVATQKRGRPKKSDAASTSQIVASTAQAEESSSSRGTTATASEAELAKQAADAQPHETPASSQTETAAGIATKAAKSPATPKPRASRAKKAVEVAEAATENPSETTPQEATTTSSVPEVTAPPAKEGRAPKAAAATTSSPSVSVPASQSDAIAAPDVEAAAVPVASTATAPDAALSVPAAATVPVKKKFGRPTKTAKAAAEAAAAAAAAEKSRLSQTEITAAPANEAQTAPIALAEAQTETLTNVPAPPAKKVSCPRKSAKTSAPVKAAGAAVAPAAESVPTTQEAAAHAEAAESDKDPASTTASAVAANGTEQPVPGSSGSSLPEAAQEEAAAAVTPAASKRSTTAAKPRASKANGSAAAAKAAVALDACMVCGATPSHDDEQCPIWQGGSQAILDLLAMIRSKKSKNKNDKEVVKILYAWLSKQFGAPSVDFTASQDSIKSTQQSPDAPGATQSAVPDANSVAIQADAGPASAGGSVDPKAAAAAKKKTRPKAAAAKSAAASKGVLARATPEPQFPPPSGVEGTPTAAETAPAPPSSAKPAARTTRGEGKKAATAAAAKSIKKAAAQTAFEAEPRIAVTPSSPPQPSSSQSSGASGSGLRASSESSEAELATSPMLSAVPHANDDVNVDEMHPQSPSRPNTAAEQLVERKCRMKLADQAASAAHVLSSSPRSRSASITSSDSSHGGDNSDEESEAQSDAEATARRGSRKTTAKQTKAASTKVPPSPAASAKARQVTPDKQATLSDSSSALSSEYETESEPDTTQKSTSQGATNGNKVKTSSTSKTSQRLAAPHNPFLRGLTPASTKQSNATTGSSSQRSTPFTRLSELKPATLRQNLSQPGSPLSTGGSTSLSASSQMPFFSSQPIANGSSNTRGVKRSARGGAASTAAKRAGKRVGATTGNSAAAKRRNKVFDVFS